MAGKKRKKKNYSVWRQKVTTAPPSRRGQNFFKANSWMISLAAIITFGLLVYSRTLNVPFILDDFSNIVDNPAIRSIWGLFADPIRPRIVGNVSFALNYWIGGLDVVGYHIFNIAIHLLNAVMVFWLVKLTLRTTFFQAGSNGERSLSFDATTIALFVGLIFVVHPVQTQAVTYIVQRYASLASLFYLLSILMYAMWRLSESNAAAVALGREVPTGYKWKRSFYYATAISSALLAMGTKEIAFTLPAVIILWEFSFFSGDLKRRIVYLIPFVLTTVLIPLMHFASGGPLFSATGITEPPPVIDYFLTQGRVIVTYIRLLFFPAGQNLDYDYPIYGSFFQPAVLISFILLFAIAGTGAALYYRSSRSKDNALMRLAGFGIFWFFITLSVESSFISIPDVIFEHRLYLPAAGLIITVVTSVYLVLQRLKERIRSIEWLVALVAILVIVVLAVSAFARNSVWHDDVSIWEDVVSKSPNKARPHTNLGVSYKDAGQLQKAQTEFELALRTDTGSTESAKIHYNLGVNYIRLGDNEKAVSELTQALAIDPAFVEAYSNLGAAYMNLRQYDQAITVLEDATSLDPDLIEAHYNLGISYEMIGSRDQATAEFEDVLRIDPGFAAAKQKLQEINQSTVR